MLYGRCSRNVSFLSVPAREQRSLAELICTWWQSFSAMSCRVKPYLELYSCPLLPSEGLPEALEAGNVVSSSLG